MSNKQLIKSAHVWALAAILAGGCWAITGKAGIGGQEQNSNQNSNSSNSNASKSQNSNRSANRNMRGNSNATGERAGMGNMTSQDHDFIMDAAMGGMMEVELGRVAAQKGMSDAVKQFGQRMVDDHSQANSELMSLASSKGITLPTDLDAKHREQVTKFSAMSGAELDREYTKMMVSDHRKDVSEFEKESTRGTDADLKAFATKTLPTLQEHLRMAEALPGAKGGGNINSAGNSNRSSNRNGNSNNSNRP
ncbi:MAG: putative rane protein [Acidobacteriota bacterium]|jgi:putative membrane protein